jgi:pimeloyl-ACP methyl ester carboxylesterase
VTGTRTVTVSTPDGRDLCVELGGDESGRPVLVYAGTPMSRLFYGPHLEDAERRGIRLISYDRPGYGGSTAKPGRSIAASTDDVRSLADALGIDRLAVWGHSGGGSYALACAALLPELITAVACLASTAPYGRPGLDYFSGMGQDNVDAVQQYLDDPEEARRQIPADREEALADTPEEFADTFASLLSPVDVAALTHELASFLVGSTKEALAPGSEGWWDDGVADMAEWGFAFDSIRVPVQLWHGAQDRMVPFQHGQWLSGQIPGVDAHLTETDGHLTLLDRVPGIHEWLMQHH